MVQNRVFTPTGANQTLPLVKKVVQDILRTGQEVHLLARELGENYLENEKVSGLMTELDDLFAELKKIGCSYRDWNFSLGLVDFPAVFNGERVLLCWRSDEPEIKFYHDLNGGYTGRKPIPPGIPG